MTTPPFEPADATPSVPTTPAETAAVPADPQALRVARDLAERLAGGLGLAAWAVGSGARIVRTHDVAATRDAILMVDAAMVGRGN